NASGDIPYEGFVKKLQSKCCSLLDDSLERLTNDANKFIPDDGNVHQVTSNTLNLLSSLMEYRQTVTQLLTACSPGSNPSYLLPRLFGEFWGIFLTPLSYCAVSPGCNHSLPLPSTNVSTSFP
ncbi:hypothetical protein Tcan_02145, partial [Toxocara canis]